jgi:hypothetical protein
MGETAGSREAGFWRGTCPALGRLRAPCHSLTFDRASPANDDANKPHLSPVIRAVTEAEKQGSSRIARRSRHPGSYGIRIVQIYMLPLTVPSTRAERSEYVDEYCNSALVFEDKS